MENPDLESPLRGKDTEARVQIALRVGERLSNVSLAAPDRRAAEVLARVLLEDTIVRVRSSLSVAVMRATDLPGDLSLKLAHDVESVSCPFLQFTEVFSDREWQKLLLTITQGARAAVARRGNISEPMAKGLAELGDSKVAETLVGNPAAPMAGSICNILLNRFSSEVPVVDKLAAREDLIAEIAIKLTEMVSAAVREELVKTYRLSSHIAPLVDEAEIGALFQIIEKTPEEKLTEVATAFQNENKLTPSLLLRIMEKGHLAFLEAAFSVRTEQRIEHVRSVILRAGPPVVAQLLQRARIPDEMQKKFHHGFAQVRSM